LEGESFNQKMVQTTSFEYLPECDNIEQYFYTNFAAQVSSKLRVQKSNSSHNASITFSSDGASEGWDIVQNETNGFFIIFEFYFAHIS
jgi:hypothetical protein